MWFLLYRSAVVLMLFHGRRSKADDTMEATVTVTSHVWTDDYGDGTSRLFRSFATDILFELDCAFSDPSSSQYIKKIDIKSLRPGSVQVVFDIALTSKNDTILRDVMTSFYANTNNATILGSLSIDPQTVTIDGRNLDHFGIGENRTKSTQYTTYSGVDLTRTTPKTQRTTFDITREFSSTTLTTTSVAQNTSINITQELSSIIPSTLVKNTLFGNSTHFGLSVTPKLPPGLQSRETQFSSIGWPNHVTAIVVCAVFVVLVLAFVVVLVIYRVLNQRLQKRYVVSDPIRHLSDDTDASEEYDTTSAKAEGINHHDVRLRLYSRTSNDIYSSASPLSVEKENCHNPENQKGPIVLGPNQITISL